MLFFEVSIFWNNFCELGVVKIFIWLFFCYILIINDISVIINNIEFCGNFGVFESVLIIFGVKVINILNSNFIDNFGSMDGFYLCL